MSSRNHIFFSFLPLLLRNVSHDAFTASTYHVNADFIDNRTERKKKQRKEMR